MDNIKNIIEGLYRSNLAELRTFSPEMQKKIEEEIRKMIKEKETFEKLKEHKKSV